MPSFDQTSPPAPRAGEPSARRPAPMSAADSPGSLAEAVPVFFRFTSARVLLALISGGLAMRLWIGAWSAADLLVIAAVALFWPIQEWLLHSRVLHSGALRIFGRSFEPPYVQRHREHHEAPWRLDLCLLPLYVHLLAPVTVVVALALLPTAALAWSAITAYFWMALQYEWIHFLVHTRFRPRSALYKRMWRLHRLHHFKNEHYWFSFTIPTLDVLVGTDPDPSTVPTSPTARTL